MAFPKNTHTTSQVEVDAILNDIAYQIENNSCPTFGDNVVAIIKSYCNYESLPSVWTSKVKLYHKDAIRKAIPIIKENGWFVWGETDYENKLTIWVTKTDIQPHPWFGRM